MDLAGNETHLNLAGFEGESTYFSRGFVGYGKEGRFSFASSSVDMAHIDNPMVPMYSWCLKEPDVLATLKTGKVDLADNETQRLKYVGKTKKYVRQKIAITIADVHMPYQLLLGKRDYVLEPSLEGQGTKVSRGR